MDTNRRIGVKAALTADTYRKTFKTALAKIGTRRKIRTLATITADSNWRLGINVVALGETLRKATNSAVTQVDTCRKTLSRSITISDGTRKLSVFVTIKATPAESFSI